MNFVIRIKKLHANAVVPERKTAGAAAYDLTTIEGCRLLPGKMIKLKTGLAFELPQGTVGRIVTRSSTFAKGMFIDGTLDEDYRGELSLQVRNVSGDALFIAPGDRLAQLIILPRYPNAKMEPVEELSSTERGDKGYGSTGT
jgi:dUTP pyrophosphatase